MRGAQNFPKKLGATSEFCMPDGWHEAGSIQRTYKCYAPRYKI